MTIFYTLKTGISPAPTGRRVKKRLLSLLPDELEGTIYELGSGWGTLARPLAKRYPQCQVVGYELSPIPWLFSSLFWRKNLRFRRKNFHSAKLDDAALIVCYLYPGAMEKLANTLPKDVPIVTHTFALPGWKAKVYQADDLYRTPIYTYNRCDRSVSLG